MKLYEFTFNDNTSMSECEIFALLDEQLKEEALLQGWAPGYKLHQCHRSEQHPDGGKEYFFAVEGVFKKVKNNENESQEWIDFSSPDGDVAASP